MTLRMHLRRISVLAGAMGLLCGNVAAQTAANVLVVVNRASEISQAVAQRYVERRHIPPENVCTIDVAAVETIERDVMETRIEQPIWECIATGRAHDRILYIVLTKHVPLRTVATP